MLRGLFSDATAGRCTKLAALFALLIGANLAVWGLTLVAFRGNAALLGTAVLAYAFGLRRAVDADHIVVGVFVLSWGLSAAIYRWKRYDELPPRRAA
ncbi:MAG: hypothetical protein NVS9B10_30790 [Nevskia sp.]